MNTSYKNSPFTRFGATGEAGVNLEQLFVSPTIAYRIADGQSIGVSFNVAYQLFKADGVGIFGTSSANPAASRTTEQTMRSATAPGSATRVS